MYAANGNERMIDIMQEAAEQFATDAFDVYGADEKRLRWIWVIRSGLRT